MLPNSTSQRPEELAFLRAIIENPGDETHYLVLGDWLEEHDDPRRAELLRLHRRLLATCCEPDLHPERIDWQARLVELLAEDVRPCVPQRTVELAGVAMTFTWVPPGRFLMGSPPDEMGRHEDENLHSVTLSQGFFLGVHQVTQAQWQAVMGSNPSQFKGDNRPVEQVSWEDGQAFCGKLSERDGKRYRLLTEAEWECAGRAGTRTPFHFGRTISTDQANYNGSVPDGEGKKGEYRRDTMPVGSFPPNAWGLCEMHGNVWEWCQDWYGPYSSEDNKDPQGADSGGRRVLRGGSWDNDAEHCRAAYRNGTGPANRIGIIGLRVCFRLD